jgi:uncharacterized protein YkwD
VLIAARGAALAAVALACAATLVADAAHAATPTRAATATRAAKPKRTAPPARPAKPGRAAGSTRAATPTPPCPGANLSPSAANIAAVDAATLCLLNEVRILYRLRPLRANRELGNVAASQVTNMVRWNYFADVRPSGQTVLSLVALTGYPLHAIGFAVGQNIGWGTGSYATPAHIVAEWMASPPHRQIMLNGEYRDAGVAVTPAVPAVVNAARQGATYAIELGVRRFFAGGASER